METDEDLETGYGAGTPSGDNLCNDYAQGLAIGFRELAEARGDHVHADDDVVLTDRSSASPFGNVAIVRRPVEAGEWPALAARMHDFFDGRQGGPFLVFSAWPTADLRGHRFGLVGHPPLMFRPAGPVDDAPIPGFEIRPVADEDTATDWESTLVHGYPEPVLQPFVAGCFLPEEGLAAPGWRHWVGYLDGAPVATASAYVGGHHVDVEFISTMPAARGKGIGRAVTAAATLAAPDRPAALISSDLGRTVYERLGYLPLLRFTLWVGHR